MHYTDVDPTLARRSSCPPGRGREPLRLHSDEPHLDHGRQIYLSPTLFRKGVLPAVDVGLRLLAHLEVQALGNVDPHIHFAVLSDFADAPSETLPRDAAILAAARALPRSTPGTRLRAPAGSSSSIASGSERPRRLMDGMGAQARQDR
jgi:hypothetical protein